MQALLEWLFATKNIEWNVLIVRSIRQLGDVFELSLQTYLSYNVFSWTCPPARASNRVSISLTQLSRTGESQMSPATNTNYESMTSIFLMELSFFLRNYLAYPSEVRKLIQ